MDVGDFMKGAVGRGGRWTERGLLFFDRSGKIAIERKSPRGNVGARAGRFSGHFLASPKIFFVIPVAFRSSPDSLMTGWIRHIFPIFLKDAFYFSKFLMA
jgi:hypothetical protein